MTNANHPVQMEQIAGGYDHGGDYDWRYFALFRDESGRLFTDSDSGCSCNSPFDRGHNYEPVESIQLAIQRANNYWGDLSAEAIDFAREALEVK